MNHCTDCKYWEKGVCARPNWLERSEKAPINGMGVFLTAYDDQGRCNMIKMDLVFDDVCMSAIRHEGLWRVATEWLKTESNWIPPLEISLTDTKMGALLALMVDGENQDLLDEALSLLSLEEVEKLTKAGLIP